MHKSTIFALALSALGVLAAPSKQILQPRAAPDNTVHITSTTNYCMIMPRTLHTDVGNSEHPGGMKSYCSSEGKTNDAQGSIPDNFWSNVDLKQYSGASGGKVIQLTGCIRPETASALNPGDGGGQYDSSGGVGGRGNPEGSQCLGYNHYVEIIEPAGNRACIRCCDDPRDCPTNKDTQGCQAVIPGNYFNCG